MATIHLEVVVTSVLLTSFLVVVSAFFISVRERKMKEKAKRNDVLKDYDIDKILIEEKIKLTSNIYLLRCLVDDIHDFRQYYRPYKDDTELEMDYADLLSLWNLSKCEMERRLAILN